MPLGARKKRKTLRMLKKLIVILINVLQITEVFSRFIELKLLPITNIDIGLVYV